MRVTAAYLAFAAALVYAQTPPTQPIPFSHKVHAGNLKIACKMCHPNPDPGETMTIAPASRCMECHSSLRTDSPAIQKLAALARNNAEIKWARIYEVPSYVNFSHRSHIQANNTCEDCHGKVAQPDQLYREANISMGACMNCHRLKKVSIDCAFCHEQRN